MSGGFRGGETLKVVARSNPRRPPRRVPPHSSRLGSCVHFHYVGREFDTLPRAIPTASIETFLVRGPKTPPLGIGLDIATPPRRVRVARVLMQLQTPPPDLKCPTCDAPLIYQQTVVSFESPERWDYFGCRSCGLFEYRHLTLRLRTIMGVAQRPSRRSARAS